MYFAVDSNCVCHFQQERISSAPAAFTDAFDLLFTSRRMILDEGGLCFQEWCQTAVGPVEMNLQDWISDLIVNGSLRLVRTRPLGQHRRRLQELGVPARDMKWFALCRDGSAEIFLTEDIDFFDPRAKNTPRARKEQIRRRGPAPVKRFFRDEAGTTVLDCVSLLNV